MWSGATLALSPPQQSKPPLLFPSRSVPSSMCHINSTIVPSTNWASAKPDFFCLYLCFISRTIFLVTVYVHVDTSRHMWCLLDLKYAPPVILTKEEYLKFIN